MSQEKEQTRILKFWRAVEIFALPEAPRASKVKKDDYHVRTLEDKDQLPWTLREYAGDKKYYWLHTLYLGVYDTFEVYKKIHQACNDGSEISEGQIQSVDGRTCLATLILDEKGRPLSGTYVQATFLHGLPMLFANKAPDGIDRIMCHR